MSETEREISLGTADYEASVRLRDAVLLRPFGISLERAQSDDSLAHHLGLFDGDGAIVACLLLIPREPGELQMRQVAVSASLQRTGHGKRLLRFAEDFAIARDARRIYANARETAVPFYVALGYRVSGEPFEQVGLPHRFVEKNLGDDAIRELRSGELPLR